MLDTKVLGAAEYLFSRLKTNKQEKSIKLKSVSPRDITSQVIKAAELLDEKGVIKFSKDTRLIDKVLENRDKVESANSFGEYQKPEAPVKEEKPKPKKAKVSSVKPKEEEKVEEEKPKEEVVEEPKDEVKKKSKKEVEKEIEKEIEIEKEEEKEIKTEEKKEEIKEEKEDK